MNPPRKQVCIFTAAAEKDAHHLQEKLLMANVDVMLLNKINSNAGINTPAFELYVPVKQEQKAKLLIKKLHE